MLFCYAFFIMKLISSPADTWFLGFSICPFGAFSFPAQSIRGRRCQSRELWRYALGAWLHRDEFLGEKEMPSSGTSAQI